MYVAALHLVPILGAEKSKVPFYIAGGALVAWALIVSLGLGLRRPDFPGGTGGERTVIAITVVLVIAAASTAVLTSGTPAKTVAATNASSTQASPTGSEASPTTSTPATSPKATTGTPAPPSSPPAVGGATTALKLAANPGGQLSYNTKQLAAKAGKVTITMTNMSPIEHNVTIAKGNTVLGATPTFQGGSKTLTLSLKPGTYTFYCSVPGHRQAGMEGTLTVSS
jgi:plastocyanin